MEEIEIIRLQTQQQLAAANLLSRAFLNDPLMVLYLPDPLQRAKYLRYLMLGLLRYCLYYGEVYTTRQLSGIACWLSPGHTSMNFLGLIWTNVGVIPIQLGWQALTGIRKIQPTIDRIHKVCIPGPHWYLMTLGVEPELQGKGIGTQLIKPKLDQAQVSGIPCYLETMTELDVKFYQKQGFKIVSEKVFSPGELHVWMMIK
jgi:ribosomal protein S18 acetylase RimI-like enzyme